MNERTKSDYHQELERLYAEIALPPKHYAQIRQSKAFMQQYYEKNLGLDELARVAFMSRFHYVRMFKQVYGMTPRNYLRDLRIAKAKALLQQGTPVTETCVAVGYESVTTFSSVFKKCTGLSPSAYQKWHKSNLE